MKPRCKLDRLTRSVKDLAELLERPERRGVALVSVADSLDTKSASGRLVLNIMMSVSQWEREAIGERTREIMQHKKSKNERVGTIPYGRKLSADGIHLETNPEEQATLRVMRELKDLGYALREIAARMNEQGLVTRRGTAWHHTYVAPLLKAA
jgi:site-specific DNA recombinase